MVANSRKQRFVALWHEHRGIAFKVASIYARSVEDRHDLVQEIDMQMWRSFDHYDERRAKFSTWMYRIALNVGISHVRKQVRTQAEHTESLQDHHLDTLGGGQTIAEPDARLTLLYRCIAELDELNRALILLYLEDRSHADMAAILGISETNVATRIGRIKQRLRQRADIITSQEHDHGTR